MATSEAEQHAVGDGVREASVSLASGAASDDLFAGDGEMGALMRQKDWTATPLGPVETWSPSLRMMVKFLLANRFPLLLWWGPEYPQFYNDPFLPVLGAKHPDALGQPAHACWREIWEIIAPLIDTPFHGGPATWMDDLCVEINRHGFVEETHFTFAYSPVPDEMAPSGIGGVLATVHEITERVVGERRVMALRDLSARSAEAKTAEAACEIAMATLSHYGKDIPFALLYLIEPDSKQARLAATTGVAMDTPACPRVIELSESADDDAIWPLAEAMRAEAIQVVDDLAARLADVPPGPWSEAPRSAVVVPVRSNNAHQLAGLLVAGVSPRLRLDDSYAGFFELVAGQIATAIANARAYEEERKRAEALAELDRAKTTFFSNVSHEFRTPLTLLLGPLEEVLAEREGALSPEQRERVEVARRNALRLRKLVNTLLDFSRIEAGHVAASYEPTDLAALTADLASAFRSAVESAGMRFVVECLPLAEPAYVDRELWEKIVLNLLSNAYKFTFEGEIGVALRQAGQMVALEVRDTGAGIPPEDQQHIFERFYRARTSRARTFEGTGIGLALVRDLVRLHGGEVTVTSTPGAGSTFTVMIPLGSAHLPTTRIGADRRQSSTRLEAAAYLEEAGRWLREPPSAPPMFTAEPPSADTPPEQRRARILLVDDNADMREYAGRLLGARWDVTAVGDGQSALASAREDPPDLVLADVMMPGLDGFALLRELRASPALRSVPVILLSARAGEEAVVEGLEAGADDYLVKPFSARELIARVSAHLSVTRLTHDLAERASQFEAIIDAMTDGVFVYDSDGRLVHTNAAVREMLHASPEFFAQPLSVRGRVVEPRGVNGNPLPKDEWMFSRTIRGEVVTGANAPEFIMRTVDGHPVYLSITGGPVRDPDGEIVGAVNVLRDITERRHLLREVEARAAELESILGAMADGVMVFDREGGVLRMNEAARRLLSLGEAPDAYRRPHATRGHRGIVLDEEGNPLTEADWPYERVLRGETLTGSNAVDIIYRTASGHEVQINVTGVPIMDQEGQVEGAVCVLRDVTERRRLERRAHEALSALLAMAETLVELPGEGELDEATISARAVAAARRMADLTRDVLGCARVAITALEPQTRNVRPVAIAGVTEAEERQWKEELASANLLGYLDPAEIGALLAGRVIVIDLRSSPRCEASFDGMLAALAPMRIGERLTGVVAVDFGSVAHAYTEQELALTGAVAKLSALTIERDRLLRERARAEAKTLALEDANQRMGNFLGIAGHELRTPLTVIKANVQLLARAESHATTQSPNHSPAREGTLLARTVRQIERLNRLVSDLVDVSRIKENRLEMRFEPCDLAAIVREAVDEQRMANGDRVIRLRISHGARTSILADEDRVGQVVTNLLTNALKYSPTEEPVAVTLAVEAGCARVSIRDHGPGIPKADQAQVWELFHRIPGIEVLSGSGVGLGLGLYICRTIVERHGGQVGVRSRVGHGTTFWFTLPLVSAAAE